MYTDDGIYTYMKPVTSVSFFDDPAAEKKVDHSQGAKGQGLAGNYDVLSASKYEIPYEMTI